VSALENAGHVVVPSLCAYAGMTTLTRSIQRIALDPAESAQASEALPWLGAQVALYLLAGWGVYGWRRWAPWVTAAVFARYGYVAVEAQGAQPLALVEAALFALACFWFLLPNVRARFRYGRWI
jgi:hypothetical protein